MKKLTALLLALMMIFSLGATAQGETLGFTADRFKTDMIEVLDLLELVRLFSDCSASWEQTGYNRHELRGYVRLREKGEDPRINLPAVTVVSDKNSRAQEIFVDIEINENNRAGGGEDDPALQLAVSQLALMLAVQMSEADSNILGFLWNVVKNVDLLAELETVFGEEGLTQELKTAGSARYEWQFDDHSLCLTAEMTQLSLPVHVHLSVHLLPQE